MKRIRLGTYLNNFREVKTLHVRANSITKGTPLVVVDCASIAPKPVSCTIEMSPDDARCLAVELLYEVNKHQPLTRQQVTSLVALLLRSDDDMKATTP